MSFFDLLSADRIVMLVAPGSRDVVLDSAARLLAGNSPTTTPVLAQALRDREQLGSTGIGRGVAIPHARTSAFREPRAAFLRLSHPIDFGASDARTRSSTPNAEAMARAESAAVSDRAISAAAIGRRLALTLSRLR